jgi:hypothetical protein
MGDRRDEERRFRGERRDAETERRLERPADRYRGSDERGYGGGEQHGELRLRNPGRDRDVRRYADLDRDRPPSRGPGAVRHHGGPGHSDLVGLHDLDDLSELREHFRGRHPPDEVPRYGHGPGVENMDRPRPPRPMGRGPKNYQRSDDRIREDLCDRLMMSWMDAENVEVLVVAGEVTLEGTVKTRDEKRAIEALAETVLGVKDIHNALRVERGGPVRTEARPGQAQEQRANDAGPTPAQQPGDTPLHS